MSPPATLALGPELTIAQAAAVREQLLAAVSAQPPVLQLELAGVTDIDSAGVQLLLAARASLQQHGGQLVVGSASRVAAEALAVFGQHGLLPAAH